MLKRLNFARDQGPLMALARQMHAEGVYAGFPLNEGRTLYIMEQLIGHPESEVYAHGWFDKHDQLVGFMAGEIIQDLWVDVRVATDHAFYIRPSARGGRGAVSLIRGFEEWAVEAGADVVRLVVYAGVNNDAAGRLLTRMGYADAGGVYKKDGAACASQRS